MTHLKIVEEASAALILDNIEGSGIGVNHSDMCKFEYAERLHIKMSLLRS